MSKNSRRPIQNSIFAGAKRKELERLNRKYWKVTQGSEENIGRFEESVLSFEKRNKGLTTTMRG
jgi:hypothetical protein